MADCKVFYSWQSDLPNSTNRGFIGEALQKATKLIRNDESIEVDPVVDRDTANVPGSPDIASTIFTKIEEAQVFVCDISIVNSGIESRRLTPNPNVLIELGYAFKTLGSERVIMIMNTAFGSPENLPFDLRMRRVITYISNKEDADKSQERNKLQSILISALSSILDEGIVINNFNRQLRDIINEFSIHWESVKSEGFIEKTRVEKAKDYLNQYIEELKSIMVNESELSTDDREYLNNCKLKMCSLTNYERMNRNFGGSDREFWSTGDSIIEDLQKFTNKSTN
jgi:hypothetical protein